MLGRAFDTVVYRGLRKQRAAAALPSNTTWLPTASGTLCVRDSGGALPPLVFTTASPCTVAHYDPLFRALRNRYRVIVFDMPGFGFSPPHMRYRHDLQSGAGAIRALLEAMDLSEVTLVCSSINGLYAMAACSQDASRLSRLMLVQTPDHDNMLSWFARTTHSSIRTPMVGQYLNFVSRRRFPPAWFRVTLADRNLHAQFAEPALAALEQGACYCFASFVQSMLKTRADDPLLSVPTKLPVTVVWGGRDRTHRHTDPASVRRHCPHADLVNFSQAGHYPDLEAPEAFAAIISTPATSAALAH